MKINPLNQQTPLTETQGFRQSRAAMRFGEILQQTAAPRSAPAQRDAWVALGTISRRTPTVSNLLVRHPSFKGDCWRIIHAEANRGKPFTRIRPGAVVHLNPATSEIRWEYPPPGCHDILAAPSADDVKGADSPALSRQASLPQRLVHAVKAHLGRSYQELDCYELVVQGLEELGIRYRGSGGLKERLMHMAVAQQRPINTFLNGEGLIKASGQTLFARMVHASRQPEADARRLYQQLQPALEKGAILAFSTPTRGHTGIVSQRQGEWTYINSGRLDHTHGAPMVAKGVGEETLTAELGNWVALASRRHEPLQITLGRLNASKLAAFQGQPSGAGRHT